MLLKILMQQDAGGPGELMHPPSRTPQVVSSSQLQGLDGQVPCSTRMMYFKVGSGSGGYGNQDLTIQTQL